MTFHSCGACGDYSWWVLGAFQVQPMTWACEPTGPIQWCSGLNQRRIRKIQGIDLFDTILIPIFISGEIKKIQGLDAFWYHTHSHFLLIPWSYKTSKCWQFYQYHLNIINYILVIPVWESLARVAYFLQWIYQCIQFIWKRIAPRDICSLVVRWLFTYILFRFTRDP